MPASPPYSLPSIPEFYRGLKIFVTGGSSLLGRILVEKLLRSCPDVHTIYLLLNPKYKTVHDLTSSSLFDRLRRENPTSVKKLVAIDGSTREVGLGLSTEDRELLQDKISVVFHLDDGVQVDEQCLRDAVLINVRGTRDVVELALGMKNLKAFLHMSSTFSHFDKAEVLEQIYPVSGDWRTIIKIVENEEIGNILDLLTPKIIGNLPNAYTYSKALAEQVINDFKDTLPLVIVRPSDVVSPVKEPYVGWVDDLRGRMTQWIDCYTVISSVIYGNPYQIRDYVPADLAAKSFIFIVWQKGLTATNRNRDTDVLPVYNCCSLQKPMTEVELMELVAMVTENVPTADAIWYPHFTFTTCWYFYHIRIFLFHLIPYILMDFYASFNGRKAKLVSSLRALFERSKKARYFIKRGRFNFCNAKFLALEQLMLARDRPSFRYGEVYELHWLQTGRTLLVARETILKDPQDTLPQARTRMLRFQITDAALRVALVATGIWKFYTNELVGSILAKGWHVLTAIIE